MHKKLPCASMWGSAKDFGTSYCFVAGTLVTTENGQEPIEEIEVGDKVLSEDETTGEVAVKTVTETYINETDELIHIGVNGETISATPTHPFYVDKLGWTLVLVGSLKAGNAVKFSSREEKHVKLQLRIFKLHSRITNNN